MGGSALLGSTETDLARTARASIVVPWRCGCEHRQRAWDHLKSRHQHPVIEAEDDRDGPWVKAAAVTPAVQAAATDVVVIADADVWSEQLDETIEFVTLHGGWALPHLDVYRLNQDATTAVIGGADFAGQPLEEPPYEGIKGGGIVVLERDLYLRVPLDPRFRGWGGEDHSWGYALQTLAGKPGMRGQGPLWHFWHPPQFRNSRRHSPLNDKLWAEYLRATGNRERMELIISEIGGPNAPIAHRG